MALPAVKQIAGRAYNRDPFERLAQINGQGSPPILATYPYHDESAALLFEVVRFNTPDKTNRFKLRRSDGNGGWTWNLHGVRSRILYRLPELVEAVKAGRRVLVCEGEEDANTAVALGYAATTMPMGPGKWRNEYDEFFRGADVVIVSDNDPQAKDLNTGALQFHPNGRPVLPGQDHAAKVAWHLRKVAAHVRTVIFPQKDLSAWCEAGGKRAALDALIEAAPDLVKSKPEETSTPDRPELMRNKEGGLHSNVGNALVFLESEPVLIDMLAFDEMRGMPVLQHPVPRPGAVRIDAAGFEPRPVIDEDVTSLQCWLQWNGLRTLSVTNAWGALLKRARDRAFHPVRDELDKLR